MTSTAARPGTPSPTMIGTRAHAAQTRERVARTLFTEWRRRGLYPKYVDWDTLGRRQVKMLRHADQLISADRSVPLGALLLEQYQASGAFSKYGGLDTLTDGQRVNLRREEDAILTAIAGA